MSMTKKDYEILAATLTQISAEVEQPAVYIRIVDKFCETLARDNPHFKRETFQTASGIYSCKICKERGGEFRTTSLPDSQSHFLTHLNQS